MGVVVALQVLIPLRALLDDSDQRQRFAWGMYSTETTYPGVSLDLDNGAQRGVAFTDVVRRRRPEMNYARDLPPFLCERFPEAASVRLSFGAPEPEVTPCP
ncbi:MAG: hypothetical protein ACR2N5_07300 [Solirubrobacterales bacterium]